MKTTFNFRKALFIGAISLSSIKTFSQSVSYTIQENNPDRRNLVVYLNPFNAQAYMPDISIGIDAQINYLLNKRFQVDADFRKAYTDSEVRLYSPKGLSLASQFQGGICFNLSNKLKTVGNRVILSSQHFGRYTLTTSINVPAEARRIFAVRGGFQYFHNNYKIHNDITKTLGGNDIQAKDKNGNLYFVFDGNNFETINYVVNSYGIYAGLDFKTIRDLIIHTPEYGTRRTKKINNIYIDVLLAPGMVYSLKPNANQETTFKNTDINISENKHKPLGWRLGWQYVFNNTVGFNMKTEVGMQPGPASASQWFITLGMGLNISLKIKTFDKKQLLN